MSNNTEIYSCDSIEKFNHAFIEFLIKENFLKNRINDLDDGDIESVFPQKNKLWLQKEVSKWKRRIHDNAFHGTLQSLQILCEATKNTPNDVLLPNEKALYSSSSIEILSIEDIKEIFLCIQNNTKGFIKICKANGCFPLQIPAFYSPQNFSITFLCIKQCRNESVLDSLEACFITYEYYMTDFFKDPETKEEDLIIRNSYSLDWVRLSNKSLFEKIEESHKKIIDLNNSQITLYDDSIFDDCGKILMFLFENNINKVTGNFFKLFPTETLSEPEFERYNDKENRSAVTSIIGQRTSVVNNER